MIIKTHIINKSNRFTIVVIRIPGIMFVERLKSTIML